MFKKILLSFICTLLPTLTYGDDNQQMMEKQKQLREAKEFQEIIQEYKNHVATTPKETMDEIIKYRRELVKLNKQKIELYNKLTQASQNYLKKEQEYKNRLPMKKEALFESNKVR